MPGARGQRGQQGGFHPSEVAATYRRLNPKMFDEFDDKELIDAIKVRDPETYKLIDPLLIGAEILPRPAAPQPQKLVPPPPKSNSLVGMGLRVIPAVAGGLAGTLIGPEGTVAGGMLGAGGGETLAQGYEKYFGERESMNVPTIIAQTALGAASPAALGESALARTGYQALYGSGLGATGTTINTYLDQGRLPTASELAWGAGMGAAFGAGTHLVAGEAPRYYQEGTRGLSGAGELPGGGMSPGTEWRTTVGPPTANGAQPSAYFQQGPSPLDYMGVPDRGAPGVESVVEGPPPGPPMAPPNLQAGDFNAVAEAAAAQYQAEEQYLAGKLKAVFGADLVRANRGNLHTLTEARSYLDELAKLKEGGVYPPDVNPPVGATPEEVAAFGGPVQPGVEGQLALPPAGAATPDATGLGPPPIRVYPAGGPPPALEEVAGNPRVIVPSEGVYGPPPAPSGFDAMELPQLPGDASTFNRDVTGQHFLQPPPAGGTAESPVSRGTADLTLGPPPMRSTDTRIEQSGRMGGRRATREQPALEGVERPSPLSDRPYAEGPNAGPRRPADKELHGTPRKLHRYVEKGVDGKTVKTREYYDSPLPAEDPATYPPEVRRELASMAHELETYKHEVHAGGATQEQLKELAKGETGNGAAAAVAKGRKSGAFGGGATPGAPVYHDVIKTGQISSNLERAEMLRQIREALLEGKGNHVTDAAAQVARDRIERRAIREAAQAGDPEARARRQELQRRGADTAILSTYEESDPLIGWVDEATGQPALPSYAVSEHVQAAREADNSDILAAKKVWDAGEQHDNPWFQAAIEEGARRGFWEHEQPGLMMEGPGGAGGPSLKDFEGGPPSKPGDVQGARPADVALPGMENVRETENAHPEIAEVPFALTPPPPKGGMRGRAPGGQQVSLFDRLKGEEGVIRFDVPAGDRAGLKKWLKANAKEHGDETWYNRVEQAVEDGEWDRAFKLAASASAKAYARAYDAARTPQEVEALRRAVKGTPLQSDINTQIVSSARARAGVGTAPPVKDFPPSRRVTQAGAARGKATLGPAGILNPGPPQRPLSTLAPALRSGMMDEVVMRTLLEGVGDPELISLVPGNEDTALRAFRQMAEQIYDMPASQVKALGLGIITPQELGQHYLQTLSASGRMLGVLGNWVQQNPQVFEAAEAMSMGGALRGMLKGEKGAPPVPEWVRGKGRMSAGGQKATLEVIEELKAANKAYDEKMLVASLRKPNPITMAEAIFDSSYAFRLAQWATAARNYMTAVGRYSIESLDHAMTVPFARMAGDVETAKLAGAQASERGLLMTGRKGSFVSPRRSWSEDVATMFDMTTSAMEGLKPKDVRNTLKALVDMPAEAAHFLGTMDERGLGKYEGQPKWIQAINSPKVRNFLTTFNRMQEFSARSTIYDSSVRAQVRAATGLSSLETAQLLQRPLPEIQAAVGGAQPWQAIVQSSVRTALEGTFAGALAKNSIPAAFVRLINTVWPAKLAIPFPAFNLARAPRFIWDHNFAGGLLELGRYQMDKRGWTTMRGQVSGGRLYRGVRAQTIKEVELPATQRKLDQRTTQLGQTMMDLRGTQRELSTRVRQVQRLAPRATMQGALPETVSAFEQAVAARDALVAKRDRLRADFVETKGAIRDLQGQVKGHLESIADAENINAPNFAQFLARQTVGVGMLGAAILLRNSPLADGTQWYQLKTGMKTDDGQDEVLDLRPYGGFVQHLYVADVVNDLLKHTDFQQAATDMSEEGRSSMNAFEWMDTLWNNYKGKYSNDELSSQFAQAFFSISRASGTTLTLAELATQDGWPNATEFGKAALGTIGQYLASYTVPLQQLDALPGVTSIPGETELRRVPKWTPEKWYRGVMAPVENTPGLKLTQPPRLNQFTGKVITTEHPTFKGLTGIGTQALDTVTAEARRVGMPMKSLMLPETGDSALDQLAQTYYAEMVGPALQDFFQGDEYQAARSPADKRDVWQAHGPQAQLRRIAWARAQETLGPERVKSARTTGEAARRELRTRRRLGQVAGPPPANPAAEEPGSLQDEFPVGPPPAAPAP